MPGDGTITNSTSDSDKIASDPVSSSSSLSVLNINVGVLGHVDSGKTSLVKALSTRLSTAALDKSKQSRDRGMTLDLGFSCFMANTVPPQLQSAFPHCQQLQITLVDCPGHASLIRTIIGGAQIIDVVLLVVDAFKGWQAQTTECLVLAELTAPYLVVALNKIDLFAESEREVQTEQARRQVRQRLARTRFRDAPIVGVAACVGGEKVAAVSGTATTIDGTASSASTSNLTSNMDELVETLKNKLPVPKRQHTVSKDTPFYFVIDHCFPVKGRGTVMTGTCLSGRASINDMIEFPDLQLERKIKSMQMFKRQVSSVQQGDRAGICVSHLDASQLERGIAASVGAVPLWKGAIALVRKVRYYPGTLPSKAKFHISVGHTTVMATVSFWGARELHEQTQSSNNNLPAGEKSAKENKKIELQASLLGGDPAELAGLPRLKFDFGQDFLQQDGLLESLPTEKDLHNGNETVAVNSKNDNTKEPLLHWALLDFQTPVHCPVHSLVIGSRLDAVEASASATTTTMMDSTNAPSHCRLAFSGRLVERIDPSKDATRLRLYTPKERRGVVCRLGDAHKRQDDGATVRYEVFGADLFKKETNMKLFLGMKLVTANGDIGEIKSSYGTSGKSRVSFPAGTQAKEGDVLILPFRRLQHDPHKAMHQENLSLPAARPGTRLEVESKSNKSKSKPQQRQLSLEAGVTRLGEIAALKGDLLENGKHNMAIVSGLFAPEINIKEKVAAGFIKVVVLGTKEEGRILGPFGKAGKCKVEFAQGISAQPGDKVELSQIGGE